MKCGYNCPFCFTSFDGTEYCDILYDIHSKKLKHLRNVVSLNGMLYSIKLSEVNGESIDEHGKVLGDVCRFNISKFVEHYYGVIRR